MHEAMQLHVRDVDVPLERRMREIVEVNANRMRRLRPRTHQRAAGVLRAERVDGHEMFVRGEVNVDAIAEAEAPDLVGPRHLQREIASVNFAGRIDMVRRGVKRTAHGEGQHSVHAWLRRRERNGAHQRGDRAAHFGVRTNDAAQIQWHGGFTHAQRDATGFDVRQRYRERSEVGQLAARFEMLDRPVVAACARDGAALRENAEQDVPVVAVVRVDVDRWQIDRAELVVLDADVHVAHGEIAERDVGCALRSVIANRRTVDPRTVFDAHDQRAAVDADAGELELLAEGGSHERSHVDDVRMREQSAPRMTQLDALGSHGEVPPGEADVLERHVEPGLAVHLGADPARDLSRHPVRPEPCDERQRDRRSREPASPVVTLLRSRLFVGRFRRAVGAGFWRCHGSASGVASVVRRTPTVPPFDKPRPIQGFPQVSGVYARL